jgi:hypothetical protein
MRASVWMVPLALLLYSSEIAASSTDGVVASMTTGVAASLGSSHGSTSLPGIAPRLQAAATSAIVSSDCFEGASTPFVPGNFSTFLVNGLNLQTETVLPGFFPVSGVQTQAIEITGGELDGSQSFLTRDATGAKVYGAFTPNIFIDGVGFIDGWVTLTPPIATPPIICLGEFIQNAGTGLFEYSEGTVFTLNYSDVARIIGLEQVTVPYGTFDALKIQEELRFFGTVEGSPIELRSTTVGWSVPGLGQVKAEITEDGNTDVFELVDTNRQEVPEPSAALMGLTSIITVAVLARRRVYTSPRRCR